MSYQTLAPWTPVCACKIKGGQTNICCCAVTPPRPHKCPSRHRRACKFIGPLLNVSEQSVSIKLGRNVCHPITTEIYLPDRHILLQGPVLSLRVPPLLPTPTHMLGQVAPRHGDRMGGFKLLIITNLTQWTVKAWHQCPHKASSPLHPLLSCLAAQAHNTSRVNKRRRGM